MVTGTVEERIRTLVAAHHQELADLVRQAVDRELQELVELELRSRNAVQNGSGPSHGQTPRPCRVCGLRPAARHRTICSGCRDRERRAKTTAAGDDGEEPHPAATPQKGRRSEGRLASDRYWAERRRQLIQQARVTTEEIGGRTFVVRHLAPQFGAE